MEPSSEAGSICFCHTKQLHQPRVLTSLSFVLLQIKWLLKSLFLGQLGSEANAMEPSLQSESICFPGKAISKGVWDRNHWLTLTQNEGLVQSFQRKGEEGLFSLFLRPKGIIPFQVVSGVKMLDIEVFFSEGHPHDISPCAECIPDPCLGWVL